VSKLNARNFLPHLYRLLLRECSGIKGVGFLQNIVLTPFS
jgi:hypothetical protein